MEFLATTGFIISSLVVLVGIWILLLASSKRAAEKRDEAVAKALASRPASHLTIKKVWLENGNTKQYLAKIAPAVLSFEDLFKGDFSETCWISVYTDHLVMHETFGEAQSNFNSNLTLATARLTLDRNGQLEVETIQVNPSITIRGVVALDFSLSVVAKTKYNNAQEILEELK